MPSPVANDPACAAVSRREMSPKNIRQPSGGREGDVDAVAPPPPPHGFELTRVRVDQGGFELTRVKGTPRRHGTVKK